MGSKFRRRDPFLMGPIALHSGVIVWRSERFDVPRWELQSWLVLSLAGTLANLSAGVSLGLLLARYGPTASDASLSVGLWPLPAAMLSLSVVLAAIGVAFGPEVFD